MGSFNRKTVDCPKYTIDPYKLPNLGFELLLNSSQYGPFTLNKYYIIIAGINVAFSSYDFILSSTSLDFNGLLSK